MADGERGRRHGERAAGAEAADGPAWSGQRCAAAGQREREHLRLELVQRRIAARRRDDQGDVGRERRQAACQVARRPTASRGRAPATPKPACGTSRA